MDRMGQSDEFETSGSRRAQQRRQRMLWGSVVGGLVVVGAAVAVFLGVGSRAGTLTTDTTTAPASSSIISGEAAAAFLAKYPVTTGNLKLAANLEVTSMSVTSNPDGTIAGQGSILIGGKVALDVTGSFTDASNWMLTVANQPSSTITLGSSGVTIDPSSITGTVGRVAGTMQWKIAGSTLSWTTPSGVATTAQFSISNTCPFGAAKCPKNTSAFLGLQNATVAFPGLASVSMRGGVSLDGTWSRLEATPGVAATYSFGSTSITINNPTLTIWRGPRTDSFNPMLVMPDTTTLSAGTGVEACGGVSVSLPVVGSKSLSSCVRWTPKGLVLGQVGNVSALSGGDMPADAMASVKGVVLTTLAAADAKGLAATIDSVVTPALPGKISLGGKVLLPGVVSAALGKGMNTTIVDVNGTLGTDSLSLRGTVPMNLNLGSEPFKVSVDSLALSLDKGPDGLTFGLGTESTVTLGAAPDTRDVTSSITLEAMTGSTTGFTLSLNAVGRSSEPFDGLTPSTRLASPGNATFLVPDLFGIRGVNLWSLTGSIGYVDGSPSLAVATTTYLNPDGADLDSIMDCTGPCDQADWMIGNLGFDVSLTSPCFVYSFTGDGANGGSIVVDGGVMRASTFQIGVAPLGCQIAAGATTLELPVGFAGFAFDAGFGSATVHVATQVSTDGFEFHAALGNVTLGGFALQSMNFDMVVTPSESSVEFDAALDSKVLGTMAFHADMAASGSTLSWNVSGSICTDASLCDMATLDPDSVSTSKSTSAAPDSGGKRGVASSIPYFTFSQSGTVSTCSSLSGAASGTIVIGGRTYSLLGKTAPLKLGGMTLPGTGFAGTSFSMDCNGINSAALGISYQHVSEYVTGGSGSKTVKLLLRYDGTAKQFAGSLSIDFERHISKSYSGQTFSRDPSISIEMDIIIGETYSSFTFAGSISADRVSGEWSFSVTSDGDFDASIDVRVNPSWAGVYHFDWNGF